MAYLAYITLYCYVILFSFRPHMSGAEIALHTWSLTYICEELHVIFAHRTMKRASQSWYTTMLGKFRIWWNYNLFSAWMLVDTAASCLMVTVFILRWFTCSFDIARVVLGINFIVCMTRLFKMYCAHHQLGPNVIMIFRMTQELVIFLLVLVVILLSYTTVSQSLVHTDRQFFPGIFGQLLTHGVWVLFGEMQDELEEVKSPDCFAQNNSSYETFQCAVKHWPPPILLAGYCFIGAVLLMNLLIAAFAYIFEQVHDKSEQLWRYYMFFLVKEYKAKSILPPPLNILEFIIRGIKNIRSRVQTRNEETSTWEQSFEMYLGTFENKIRSELLDEREILLKADQSAEIRDKILSSELASIREKINEADERSRSGLSEIASIREKINETDERIRSGLKSVENEIWRKNEFMGVLFKAALKAGNQDEKIKLKRSKSTML